MLNKGHWSRYALAEVRIGRGGIFVEHGSLVEVAAGQYCVGQVSLYVICVILEL